MARRNVDQRWNADPRRKAIAKRLGSLRLADGMLLEVIDLLLEYKGKLIPLNVFKYIENYQDWIECDLAEVQGDYVYIKGSHRYDEFFTKQQENGSKGGRPKKPRKTQTNPKKANVTQANPDETQKKPENPSCSISSSFSLSPSFSSSSSSLGSESKNPSELTEGQQANQVIANYCRLWEERYKTKIHFSQKWAGNAKTLVRDHGMKRAIELVTAFLEMNDQWFLTKRHAFDLILTDLAKISHFAGTGIQVTQTQIRQIDQTQANASAGRAAADYFRNQGGKG